MVTYLGLYLVGSLIICVRLRVSILDCWMAGVNLLWLQSPYRDKCHHQLPLNSIALHTINITINIYIHEITSAI
jgi:hypothetical protein